MTTLEIWRNIASFSEALIRVFTSLSSTLLDSWLLESFLSSQSITCDENKPFRFPHLIVRVVLTEVVDVRDVLVLDHVGPNPDEMNSCRKTPGSLLHLFDRGQLQLNWTFHHLVVEICQRARRQGCQRKRWFSEFRRHLGGEKFRRHLGGDNFRRHLGGEKIRRHLGGGEKINWGESRWLKYQKYRNCFSNIE